MLDNPHDPRKRRDLSVNEKRMLEFMQDCLHGDNDELIDRYVAEDYIQHTPGVGQGREGIRNYLREVARRRPGRREFTPVHIFSDGDFVILHKLIASAVIVDIVRFNEQHQMAEHWDVVQRHPEPGYDPMRPSSEDLERFRELFR